MALAINPFKKFSSFRLTHSIHEQKNTREMFAFYNPSIACNFAVSPLININKRFKTCFSCQKFLSIFSFFFYFFYFFFNNHLALKYEQHRYNEHIFLLSLCHFFSNLMYTYTPTTNAGDNFSRFMYADPTGYR